LVAGALAAPASAQLEAGWRTELSTIAHSVSGVVSVVDQDTIRVDNFNYDSFGIEVYFYLAANESNNAIANGLAVGPDLVGTVYDNDTLIMDLPAGETVDSYSAVSVWCVPAGANFGSGTFEHPRAGETTTLSELAHQVAGQATIVDHNTVRLDNFSYDGLGFEVYAILGTENTNAAFANGLRISDNLLGTAYNNDTLVLDLPPGETIDGYHGITIWCVVIGMNFGSGEFASPLAMTPPSFVADKNNDVEVTGATPNGLVLTGYSLTGAGPTNTSVGLVALSQPIERLPNMVANAAGRAEQRVFVPAAAAGIDIWMQAYDMSSGRLTEGIMTTVQ